MAMKILTINNKKDNKFLRKKTALFDFDAYSKDELRKLINDMKSTMRNANGVGLAANQVGINERFFIVEFEDKFYAIFNPEIVKFSKKKNSFEEGCLSIPEEYGELERPSEITIKGFDRNGKRIKMRIWGHLAQIFQHEVDHLDGKLFIDKVNK